MPELPQIELVSSTAQTSGVAFPFSQILDSGMSLQSTMFVFGIQMQTVDIALFVLCPIFATLGILVASLLNNTPYIDNQSLIKRCSKGLFSNLANILVGLSIGIVIALFFIGSINNDITSLARVLVLTIFLGYKAPIVLNFRHNSEATYHSRNLNNKKMNVSLNEIEIAQEKIKQAKLTNGSNISVA